MMESADLATGRADCHAASPLAAAPDHAHLASEPVIRHLVGTVQHAFESAEHAACANHRSVIAPLPGLSAGRRMMEGMNALIGIRIELRDAQGMLVGAVFGLYPLVLPASTDPAYSLTIYNSAAGHHGLAVGLAWWILGAALAFAYFIFIYRMFRGKVKLEGEGY